jgi:glycosyltransferase involved in cell wall biosynthesis
MRVLYASERAYIPDRVDGALYSAHCLLDALWRRGHRCEAVASLGKYQPARRLAYRALRALSARSVPALPDWRNGYPTWRSWEGLVQDVVRRRLDRFRPDVLLTQLDGAEAIARIGIEKGVPTFVWIRDNEFAFFTGNVPKSPLLLTLADSDFVARAVQDRLGYVSPVIYPPVRLERCLVQRRQPDSVTLINPVWQKGVEIALEVARRLPHRRFLFVETWPLRGPALEELQARLTELPNVTFRRWSKDIRPVYERTLVLLAPSQWVESFCTVVFEANVNGIPAIASRIGGIPATLGKGGLLLDPDTPAGEWAAAVEALLSDRTVYDRLSRQALENAARKEFRLDVLADRFLAIASEHAARASRRRVEGVTSPRMTQRTA